MVEASNGDVAVDAATAIGKVDAIGVEPPQWWTWQSAEGVRHILKELPQTMAAMAAATVAAMAVAKEVVPDEEEPNDELGHRRTEMDVVGLMQESEQQGPQP